MHLSLVICFSLAMENWSKTSFFSLQNLLFLFFFIQYLVVPVTGDAPVTPYDPVETITIDCGSSEGGTSLDQRPWFGDGSGKFSLIEQPNNKNKSLAIPSQSPSSVDTVPYTTARVSYSEFTYSIPLTTGPKFIRFYFYPTSYSGFGDPSNKAFFSVKAGQFTLLRNFSAVLHAPGEHPLVKEYCVHVDEGRRLNLTFIPSPDIAASYAFINGIEVVSMPPNLYYGAVGYEDGVPFLGQDQGSLYHVENYTAVELMYRINVGGSFISPNDDTGMFRTWLNDEVYLTIAKPSALPVNTSVNLTFSSIPSFSAPRKVYLTARSMGTNKNENEIYNLTWEFPVDSGFNYLARLHFCEFQREVTKLSDRDFKIFLANLTAETQADVIAWSGGNGVPIYRDYVVPIGRKGNQKQQNLSIVLYPSPAWRTLYSDAILNGVEIFKLSNGFDLAGPNPDPIRIIQLTNSPPTSTKSNDDKKPVFDIVGGVISGFVVLSLLCFFFFRRKMRLKDAGSNKGILQSSQVSSTMKSSKPPESCGSSLPSDLCRCFSLAEIKGATNNFDDVFIVGFGGFGNVYKGFIDGGSTQVAIKRLNPGSQQGAHEFRTEIEMLSQLRHVHLVSLIGYCNDGGEMILVYDYMSRGTLRNHLYNSDNPPLPWKQRLEICLGAAIGLQYLHSGAKHPIIHRDVKTTNILLDEKWVAKVSDFGLSRIGPTNMSQTHVSTVVKGSLGYLDPEYSRRGQLTEKSDVYSFGVVLCEILCARPPLIRSAEKAQISLAPWFQQCRQNGTLDKIIDPFLKGKIVPECLKKFTEVVMNCLDDEGTERPSMDAVVWGLQFALQLQELAEEEEGHMANAGAGIVAETPFTGYEMEDDSEEVFSSIGDHVMNSKSISTFNLTTSDEQSFMTEDSDKNTTKAVFSEIRDPQGR
ncbi:putative Malectin/receptor-like protein kinase family protein [Hibiscus syriacus]|uniref:Malectin/receptor-like protein kinase family protein n=1 Tax=Hibiscus syriacus TaxID=106335 RepID=A0A6A2Z073_HIBSY|nr:receptor-like protein kinase FERONIA [Hibiscus syriacus]KAE8685228.1 putative Malectin/receptor-like protein kinase family protein [Hibiscus syriacus]